MNDDYKTILARDIDMTPKYSALGVSQSMLANRISWTFDLKGPSLNVDTACSSSLMAVDLACQAIRSGDISMVSDFLNTKSVLNAQLNNMNDCFVSSPDMLM